MSSHADEHMLTFVSHLSSHAGNASKGEPTRMRVAVEADTPKATVLMSGLTTDIASRMETTEYA